MTFKILDEVLTPFGRAHVVGVPDEALYEVRDPTGALRIWKERELIRYEDSIPKPAKGRTVPRIPKPDTKPNLSPTKRLPPAARKSRDARLAQEREQSSDSP